MTKKFINTYLILVAILIAATNLQATENAAITSNIQQENNTIFTTLQSEQISEVVIKTNLDSLVLNKRTMKEIPAEFIYTKKDGTTIEQSVKLIPRGKSRRNYCQFPPLKISFSKKGLEKNGINPSHKTLKLVTHCLDDLTADANVLKEYLAYTMYNELTDNSLKAQLLKIRYEDTNSDRILEHFSILLEDIDELAERLGGEEVKLYNLEVKSFPTEVANTFVLFQYMIGNEDWSLITYQNIKYIDVKKEKKVIPIPYDFDSSGLVNTSYAKPNKNHDLESVKQRFFKGDFKDKKTRQQGIAVFYDKKDKIYQTVAQLTYLDELHKIEIIEYLDAFYKTIETPELVKRAFSIIGIPEPSDLEGEMHIKSIFKRQNLRK